jgi:hypothetical protein
MKRIPKGAPVAVYWEDAADHPSEWQDVEDVEPRDDVLMVSYGVYLGVKKKNILLAATYCERDQTVNSASQVPLGCVKRVVRLKE